MFWEWEKYLGKGIKIKSEKENLKNFLKYIIWKKMKKIKNIMF